MGYIVDLTLVMDQLFLSYLHIEPPGLVTVEEVEMALENYKTSEATRVHQAIREYATWGKILQAKKVQGKVIELINQHRVTVKVVEVEPASGSGIQRQDNRAGTDVVTQRPMRKHLRVPRFGADTRPRPEGLTPVGKQPFSSFPLLLKTTFKTSSLYPLNSTCPAIPSSYPVSDYLKPPRISPTNYTALQHSHLPYLARFSRRSWRCPPAHCPCPLQRLSSSSSFPFLP